MCNIEYFEFVSDNFYLLQTQSGSAFYVLGPCQISRHRVRILYSDTSLDCMYWVRYILGPCQEFMYCVRVPILSVVYIFYVSVRPCFQIRVRILLTGFGFHIPDPGLHTYCINNPSGRQ